MKSLDWNIEKQGIHEGDEGIYGKSTYGEDDDMEYESAEDFRSALDRLEYIDDEDLETESADDFRGALDKPKTSEINDSYNTQYKEEAQIMEKELLEAFGNSDFGRTGFGDDYFVTETDRLHAIQEEAKALTPKQKKAQEEFKTGEAKEINDECKDSAKKMESMLDDLFR